MKTAIFIEGNPLELSEDITLEINKSIDEIQDITSRNSSYTKTITIPGTANNNWIFGHIFDVNVFNSHDTGLANVGYNYNAAKNAEASILIDGMEVIRGAVRILEIKKTGRFITYEISIVGDLGGLVLAMGDKELTALDFSEHNHTYNASNITASWAAAPGSGYYYPLIDYGYTTDGINFPIESIRPALYVREYLDKIIKGAGYTWESSFFDSARFKRLIIPNNKDGLYTSPAYSFYRKRNTSLGVTGTQIVTYDESVGEQLLTDPGTGYITSARSNFSHKFNVEALVNITGAPGTITWGINLVRTSATLGNQTFNIYQKTAGYFSDQVVNINAGAIIEVANGDSVRVEIVKSSGSMTVTASYVYFYGIGTPTLKVPIISGDTYKINETIPVGIKQKDFLLAITRMFNLYITESPTVPKRLVFTPFSEFYQPATSQEDWTSKIDHSQEMSIKPLGELTSRYYNYSYKKDGDYYNDLYEKKYGRVYGTRIYDSGADFVAETTKVEIIFSPTPGVNIQNRGRIVPAIFKLNGTTVEPVGFNIRILYRSTAAVACSTWYIKEGGTTLVTASTYPYAGHLDRPAVDLENDTDGPWDLCYGAPEELYHSYNNYPTLNLFNEFWAYYIANLSDKDSKLVTMYILLKPGDVQALDFSKEIFIGGQNFRLNRVDGFNNLVAAPTLCEFINVIYG